MSFSLKYLFLFVTLSAIFSAALIYPLSAWPPVTINLTLVVLAAATLGVSLQRLNKTFWLPFLLVGWLYLAIAFMPKLLSISSFLPSKYVTFHIKEAELQPRFANIQNAQQLEDIRRPFDDDVVTFINPFRTDHPTNSLILRFRRLADILDALFALIAGALAGFISVLVIRPKRGTPSKAAAH
jgi:hypothetical protein